TAEEKKTRKIDRLARSLLIQGLPNDIYSLIDSNETAKNLWDAVERQMRGSEYGEQDRKATILSKEKVVVSSDSERSEADDFNPLALVAEKTNVSKRKEKVVVSSDSERSGEDDFMINDLKKSGYKKDNYYEGSGADYFSELKKITSLLAKAFNRRNFYSKPTNNNLRTSFTSHSANKKQEFVKSDDKKVEKKDDEKKRDMSKVNDSDQEINANMVFIAQIEKVLSESDKSSSSAGETIAEVAYYTSESESEYEFETLEYYDNSTNYGLFVNNDDDQEIFHDAIESTSENFI
nr:hypothetical protein [Tanacetum cinerariifolium]